MSFSLHSEFLNKNMKKIVMSYLKPTEQLKFACISKSFRDVFCILHTIESSQFKLFLKHLHILQKLYETENKNYLEYCNVFHHADVSKIKSPSQMTSHSKLMTIIFMINSFTISSCMRYLLKASSESEVKDHIEIIKHLRNRHMVKYVIDCNLSLSTSLSKELYNLIKNYRPKTFFTQLTIDIMTAKEEEYEFDYVNVDMIPIEIAINYSIKYPNKIKQIDTDNVDKSKEDLKKLAMLNNESLTMIPNPFFDLYTSCKNIKEFSFMSITENLNFPDEFDYSKIERIHTIAWDTEGAFNLNALINILNKMPNLKYISFSTFCTFNNDDFNDLFNQLNTPLLTKIEADLYGFEDDYEYSFLLERFPHLIHLLLEEHESMSFSYSIKKIFSCEKTQISMESLEKMIRNYLSKNHHSLVLNLTAAYTEAFLKYFNEKQDIMKRVMSATLDAEGKVKINYAKNAHFKECYAKPMIDCVDYAIIEYEEIPTEIIEQVKLMKPVIINVVNETMKKLSDCKWIEGILSVKFVKINHEIRYVRKGNEGFVEI